MRTLNDITPPSRRKEMGLPTGEPSYPGRDVLRIPERKPKFPFATLTAILLVIVASIGALFYFSSAKVTVIPNTFSAAVQNSFTASQSEGVLPYEVISAEKIATRSVKSSGTKTVTSSASGMITIYNTQTKAQPLVTNTRFATTGGLIFRIKSPVTIPGGSKEKPGSVTARAYADQAGATYNVGPTSFTVPGFAGTPQEGAVYARSTGSMTGGASGEMPVVDTALEQQTRAELIKALTPDLISALQEKVPDGYILLPGAASTTFESLSSSASETTGQVDVKEQGRATAVIFPISALAKAIATAVANNNGYQGEPLVLSPDSSLALSAPSIPDGSGATLTFTLSGTASFMYTVDQTRIAAAVAGKTSSAAEVALTNYPEVKRAHLLLRPFWRKSFPQDPSSIVVVVANP